MTKIIRIGMDTSKSVFVLHGVDAAEQPILRRKLRRKQVLEFFARLEPTKVGLEACGAAHYWARELRALGHEVVLVPPQYVKPYVKPKIRDEILEDATALAGTGFSAHLGSAAAACISDNLLGGRFLPAELAVSKTSGTAPPSGFIIRVPKSAKALGITTSPEWHLLPA